jgi:uncharacterized repeat protein (TIGR01451 family)
MTTAFTLALSRKRRLLSAGQGALLLALAGIMAPANAAIDNTATASGSYGASTVTSSPDPATVPVTVKDPRLSLAKSAAAPTTSSGANGTITDAGDTITFTYIITNNGNVTISGVTPVDTGPTFNGAAGTGSLGAFTLTAGSATLAPGQSATFTAVYTLTQADVDNAAGITNGVANSASPTGTDPQNSTIPSMPPGTAIAAGPLLTIDKTATLTDTNGNGTADVGEVIVYRYRVSNTGNVALTNVAISDTHEGTLLASSVYTGETLVSDGPLAPGTSSSDATANNGIWSTLQAGAVVDIFYNHTVTQTEFNNQ